MFSRLTDRTISPVWHAQSAAEGGASRHRLEDEIVLLLEQYSGPLLRYRPNFGLASRRRYRTRVESDARTEAGFGDLARDTSPSPEAQMAHTQAQQLLLAAVKALPGADRRCPFLRAEGWRCSEIAGIPVSPSVRYPFLWHDLWRASRALLNG